MASPTRIRSRPANRSGSDTSPPDAWCATRTRRPAGRHVLVRVEVWRGAPGVRPQQVGGRYLRSGVERVQIGREAANQNQGESACPPAWVRPGGERRPGEGGFGTQAGLRGLRDRPGIARGASRRAPGDSPAPGGSPGSRQGRVAGTSCCTSRPRACDRAQGVVVDLRVDDRGRSAGSRTEGHPRRSASGAGVASALACMSETTSCTSARIPENASCAVDASQLSDGNSAQSPAYSPSSGDQVTRYV